MQRKNFSRCTHTPTIRSRCGKPSAGYVDANRRNAIVGIEGEQARTLIDGLEGFITQPAFVYSHRWQDGDLVIWDNRCTLHRATPYAFDRDTRTLWRTQVKGSRPQLFNGDA